MVVVVVFGGLWLVFGLWLWLELELVFGLWLWLWLWIEQQHGPEPGHVWIGERPCIREA